MLKTMLQQGIAVRNAVSGAPSLIVHVGAWVAHYKVMWWCQFFFVLGCCPLKWG